MLDMKKYGIVPFGAVPNERQLAHYKMKKAFFHFGVNTFTDTEWGNGEETEKLFAPTDMNVEQWVESIRKAGFDLAILTAKHHDGFCLWPSRYTEHSVKNSPYKNGNAFLRWHLSVQLRCVFRQRNGQIRDFRFQRVPLRAAHRR